MALLNPNKELLKQNPSEMTDFGRESINIKQNKNGKEN